MQHNDNLRTNHNHQEHQTYRRCHMRFNLWISYRMAVYNTIGAKKEVELCKMAAEVALEFKEE